MNSSGKVVSALDLASRVLGTTSFAQPRYRVQSGDGEMRGEVFSWVRQLYNLKLLISESHIFIGADGSNPRESQHISRFRSTTPDRRFRYGARQEEQDHEINRPAR